MKDVVHMGNLLYVEELQATGQEVPEEVAIALATRKIGENKNENVLLATTITEHSRFFYFIKVSIRYIYTSSCCLRQLAQMASACSLVLTDTVKSITLLLSERT